MKRGFYLLTILFCSLSFLFSACGGSAGGSLSSSISNDGTEFSGDSLEGGAVTEVNFDNSSASVNFGAVSSSSEYVLAIYSYDENGNTKAFEIAQSGSLSSTSSLVASPSALLSENQDDLTEDFHQRLREEEARLDPSAMIDLPSPQAALMKATGEERYFKVLNSFSGSSSYEYVTGVVVYESANFRAYIDQRNLDSLDADDIEDLFSNFDDVTALEQDYFGSESDVDKDGKFNILLTQVVNELGGSSGGIVTGFWYAVDLFSNSDYAQSNETEIIYTFVPDPTGEFGTAISKSFALSNILPSVLPHEYQHMISFNMHYFENDGSPERSFLNEGLAHLAEDIYSADSNDYMTTTGVENPARIAGYLASIEDLCIVCGSSLYQRGGSYLLVRYLYEQAEKGNLSGTSSGKDLLNKLLDTSETGVENIVQAAYGSSDTQTSFSYLMGQFGLALFMDNSGLTDDDRLEINGINLRASQNDNRGTVLQGPAVNAMNSSSLSDTVSGASINYVKITGETINDLGGNVNISLADNSGTGAYLIQTGL